jgi:hypothetical protein
MPKAQIDTIQVLILQATCGNGHGGAPACLCCSLPATLLAQVLDSAFAADQQLAWKQQLVQRRSVVAAEEATLAVSGSAVPCSMLKHCQWTFCVRICFAPHVLPMP